MLQLSIEKHIKEQRFHWIENKQGKTGAKNWLRYNSTTNSGSDREHAFMAQLLRPGS